MNRAHKSVSHQISSLHTILCDQISSLRTHSLLLTAAAVAVRLVLRVSISVAAVSATLGVSVLEIPCH